MGLQGNEDVNRVLDTIEQSRKTGLVWLDVMENALEEERRRRMGLR